MKEPKSKKKGCLRIVVAVILVLIGFAFLGKYFDRKTFESNKPQILQDARSALEAKNVHKVASILKEHERMDDSDLNAIASELESLKSKLEQQAKVKARERTIERVTKLLRASTAPSGRQNLIEELNEVDPKNKEFSKELEAVRVKRKQELVERKKERQQKEAERLVAENKARTEHIAILNGNWHYGDASDSMSKGKVFSAVTKSRNTLEFKFPYQGAQRGTITLRTHPRHGKDVIFSIQKGQILSSLTSRSTMLVRFDENKAEKFSYLGAADHNSTTVFIKDYHRFVSKMLKAKRVRIAVDIYQEGSPVFEFNVADFSTVEYLQQ